jgi:hypothetical protein
MSIEEVTPPAESEQLTTLLKSPKRKRRRNPRFQHVKYEPDPAES